MVNWIERLPSYRGTGLLLVADGGATNCRVAIASPDGSLLGFGYAHGRPTNSRAVGNEAAVDNLRVTVSMAVEEAGVDPAEIETCLITSASIDTDDVSQMMTDALADVGLAHANSATVPDTMGCWASTSDLAPAVAIISGTGSVVVAADRERGIWRRFGGWDYLLGDEGSGYALGRRAIQETLLVHEGRSSATALADGVLAQWGGGDPDGLPDAVHKPAIDKAWIASFAPLVLDGAQGGDERCLAILDEEIAYLADASVAAVAVLDTAEAHDQSIRIGLFGGVVKAPVFKDRFTELMQRRCEAPLEILVPEHSAIVGAAALALIDRPADERRAALDRLDTAVDEVLAQRKV